MQLASMGKYVSDGGSCLGSGLGIVFLALSVRLRCMNVLEVCVDMLALQDPSMLDFPICQGGYCIESGPYVGAVEVFLSNGTFLGAHRQKFATTRKNLVQESL
jgi:hypothetical protein